MRKGNLEPLAALLLMSLSPATSASEVTITHTFSPGEPARADEVNRNFLDIKSAVDDNHLRLTDNEGVTASNAAAISSNAAAISINNAEITTNADTIANLGGAINSNTDASTANASAIDLNSARIASNETAITSLSQAVNIYDSHDNRLGRFISVAPLIDSTYSKWVHQGAMVWVLSDKGYLFALQRWYGVNIATLRGVEYFTVPTSSGDYTVSKAKLYYPSTNCTGPAYLSSGNIDAIAYTGFSPVISVRGGLVFQVTDMSGTKTPYYLPKGNSIVPIAYESARNGDSTSCTQYSQTLLEDALAVFPNDMTITGVSNSTDYTWPLRFDF